MNILITGGAGFIGSHVCEELLKANHKVICVDNFDEFYSKSIKQENIRELKDNPKFHLITCDVRNTDDLIDILTSKKVDTVFHLAGRSGAANSIKNPLEFISSNVQGTVSLLEAMREAEVQKLLFVSSSSVYGNSDTAPFNEILNPGTPTSTYAETKLSAESFVKMYQELYGISAVVVRMFSVFGPRQRPDSGIHQFIRSNLKNFPLSVYAEGKILRDYTFVNDIVSGIISAGTYLENHAEKSESGFYELFNLGSGSPIDINGVLAIIEKITGNTYQLNHKKSPVGNLNAAYADITKAEKILGYKPKIQLEDGIRQTINWMKEH